MITLIISARTTLDRPRAEAIRHLKTVHGPLVYDAPADAGVMPSVYVQNHVEDDLPLPAALEGWRWDRHLVTEISFETIDHLKASTATPYYRARLQPDEPRFVDPASVRPLVIAGPPVVETDATWKLFVYIGAAGDREDFDAAWVEAREISEPFIAAQTATRVVDAPGAPPAFVDGVWSLWFDTADQARAFAADHLEPALKIFGDHIDGRRGRIVLAEQFTVDRLRAENALPERRAVS